MKRVASGEVELHTAQIVVEETKQNPHEPTREKELVEIRELGIQSLKIFAAFDDHFPKSKYLDLIKTSDTLKLLLTIYGKKSS